MRHTEGEAAQDTKRDVVALYRAGLNRDLHGMSAIVDNTRCLGCLAVGAIQVGLWLAINSDEHLDGETGMSREYFAEVNGALDHLQYEIDGISPPPEAAEEIP